MKYLKNDVNAVSPVIATILMVAITVILAGVLLIMLTGLNDGTSIQTGDFSGTVDGDEITLSVVLIPGVDVNDIVFNVNGEVVVMDWNGITGTITNANVVLDVESIGEPYFVTMYINGDLVEGKFIS